MSVVQDDTRFPREFDGFRIVRLIGQGGMGSVYLGHDTLLDRQVAIKFISHPDPDAEARRRFQVEARAIARLQHPCVVTIYRTGEIEGHPYLVSEFVPGESLDRLPMPIPWRRALEIGYELARGLAVAHQVGVVHRDVKPANVMLSSDGSVKILDFGIASLVDATGETRAETSSPRRIAPVAGAPRQASPPGPAGTIRVEVRGVHDSAGLDARPGSVVGTPAYLAPEVWRGEPATFASDVYSLGALLYELCSGHPPHEATTVDGLRKAVLGGAAAPLSQAAPDADPAFGAIVDRCLRRDPSERPRTAGELRTALAALTREDPAGAPVEGNPYRGLDVFDSSHRALFFGRDSEVKAILARLSNDPVVLVAGDSGVGKSSLCRAGVLPRVSRTLDGGRAWSTVTLAPGRHPVAQLCSAVAAHLGQPETVLAAAMEDGPAAFGREIRKLLGPGRGLVVFMDQFEEIVTLAGRDEAGAVAELFGWLASSSLGLKLVAAVRGDFLGRLAVFPAIGDTLTRYLYFLRPLSAERLREVIAGPALASGVSFEPPELVDVLVESTVDSGGGLPLLEFALAKLWEARDPARQVISAAALQSLGGVGGALSLHADDVLACLRPTLQPVARRILVQLVTGEGTRASRPREDLVREGPDAEATLDALVVGRLVVARDTEDGGVYELAHETLIRGWATMSGWLAHDADRRAATERLARARADWERQGRPRDALWSHRRLSEVASLDPAGLPPADRSFLRASRRAAHRAAWLRRAAFGGVFAALAVTWGGVRYKAALDLGRRVDEHLVAGRRWQDDARSRQPALEAARTDALALFDRRERVRAEDAWAGVLSRRSTNLALLARASREFESAVMLAPDNADARALFADTLLERARRADEGHEAAARDELVARMGLYDDGGTRTRNWHAPAVLFVGTAPPVASIALERFEADPSGRLQPQPVEGDLASGGPGRELAPGSYLLTLRAPARADVRLPVTLSRGEILRLHVELPLAGEVPADFVYVPAGRFLFGSADEDSLRRGFLHAVPIHAVGTGPYFIARHETTFAEWIEYLEALPPSERLAHVPRVALGGFEGALELKEIEGHRWQLSIKPAPLTRTARSGEPMTFPGRGVRRTQDWPRLPVTGVTAADAAAYAAWLAGTKRVPGARLCTEIEWERAARGADDRAFPHGNSLAPEDANYDQTYGKVPLAMGPDEVGSHPASRSPFGVDDMAGNAWEWTVSSVDPTGHAARGGSYYFDVNSARVANRETPEPSFRDVSVGLRVCADVRSR